MKKVLVLILILAMVGLSGCIIDLQDGLEIRSDDNGLNINFGPNNPIEIGELKTHTKVIELGSQEKLDVKVDINAANIDISASEDKLFKGEVETDIQDLIPIMELNNNKLVIKDQFRYNSIKKFNNDWNLKITDQIPLSMDIRTNATKNDFDFTGLQIEELEMYINAADTDIKFNEKNRADFETFKLDVNAGSVEAYGLDYAAPEEIEIDVNAGDVELEFGDNITRSTEIYLEGNAANVTLNLPSNVGISIEKGSNLVNIDTRNHSFNKTSDGYMTDNYDTAEYIIDIVIRGAVFNVTVE